MSDGERVTRRATMPLTEVLGKREVEFSRLLGRTSNISSVASGKSGALGNIYRPADILAWRRVQWEADTSRWYFQPAYRVFRALLRQRVLRENDSESQAATAVRRFWKKRPNLA